MLADALRLSIPFIPHIIIGANVDPNVCKTLAADIDNQDIQIKGEVSALNLILHENEIITTLTRIAFEGDQ